MQARVMQGGAVSDGREDDGTDVVSGETSLDAVVRAQMPGWKLARSAAMDSVASTQRSKVDAVLPAMDVLQNRQARNSVRGQEVLLSADDSETPLRVVEVESGSLRKTVGIQGGRVKWSQG